MPPADTDDLPEKQDLSTIAIEDRLAPPPRLLRWIPLRLGSRKGIAILELGGLHVSAGVYDDDGLGDVYLGALRFDLGHTLRPELLQLLLAAHPEVRTPL